MIQLFDKGNYFKVVLEDGSKYYNLKKFFLFLETSIEGKYDFTYKDQVIAKNVDYTLFKDSTDTVFASQVLFEEFITANTGGFNGGGAAPDLTGYANEEWVLANFMPIQADNSDELLIMYFGQSNAGGRVPIANASAGELLPQTNVNIWNQTTQIFEPLYVPTNNQSGFNQFGSEIVFASKVSSLYPGKTINLVKYHVGNTRIDYWMDGGDGKELYKKAFIYPAIYKILSAGKNIGLTLFYHQGEADNSPTFGGSVHLDNLRDFVVGLRNEFSNQLPIILGEIESSTNEINSNFLTIKSEYTNIDVALMEGASTIDGIHFDNTSIRSLGNQQFDLMPLKYGAKLIKTIPVIYHYLIRTLQFSEIESSLYNLIIDLEYCSIHQGNTNFYIDDVLIDTISLSDFGTQIVSLNGLNSDGLSHTLKIKNTYNNTFIEEVFNAPSSSVSSVINIDFSGYTVPTTDATKFEEWKGQYTIDAIAGSKGLHLTSDTGGLYTDSGRFVRLLDIPTSTQSFTMDFDGLFEINSTAEIESYVSYKSFSDGSAQIKGYRVRIRHNRIYLYSSNGAGVVLLADSGAITSPTINTWRKYKIVVNGYNTTVSYSNDNGVTYIQVIDFTQTDPLTFGIPTTKLFYNTGTILLGATGSQKQKFWYKNINITT